MTVDVQQSRPPKPMQRRARRCLAVLEEAVDRAFSGTGSTPCDRVGIELELFAFRRRPDGAPTPMFLHPLRRLVEGVPGVSFEPGGQLELNPPPAATAAEAIAHVQASIDRLRTLLGVNGVGLLAVGLDPWQREHVRPLQLRTSRYLAMRRHLAAIGDAGPLMMLRSAALQVSVDLRPGTAGAEQWRVANLTAPILGAVFANSPAARGGEAPGNGRRIAMWELVDPTRAGSSCIDATAAPGDAYLELALRAEAIPLPRGDDQILPFRRPFGEWMLSGGLRPDRTDVIHHLSTLFPPVRPRGAYLEVRVLDSLPARHRMVAVSVVVLLLLDANARSAALDLLKDRDLPRRWATAAGPGVRDSVLRGEAMALLTIAAEAAERGGVAGTSNGREIVEFATRYTASGRAPGDDGIPALSGRLFEGGP